MRETDESEENHILSLRDADGYLIKILYSFPREIKYVGSIGATSPLNAFGDVEWSPDGEIFAMQTCGYRYDNLWGRDSWLCDLNLFTSDGEPILNEVISSVNEFSWSPTGEWLAYTFVAENGNREIHLLKSDGSEDVVLVDYPNSIGYPEFSPDGSQVLYWVSGGYLRVINIDGSGDHLIGSSKGRSDSYSWSPDSTVIAFSHPMRGLFQTNSDGTDQVLIFDDNKYRVFGPRYSPDGKYFLFDASSPQIGRCFYVIPSDLSTQPRLLGSGWDARWSPDGSLVFLQGWPLYIEQSDPLSYYETPFYAVSPDASQYWLLEDRDIGLVRGIWKPGSFAQAEHIVTPITTYEVPQNWDHTSFSQPAALVDFEGVWLNQDSCESGDGRLEIRTLGDTIIMRSWSSCDPELDYYNGELATRLSDLDDNILQFVNESYGRIYTTQLSSVTPGSLVLIQNIEDEYGISKRQENFIRLIGKVSYEPVSSCPPVLGNYDPFDYPYPKSVDSISGEETISLPIKAPAWQPFKLPDVYDSFDGDSINYSTWFVPEGINQSFDISQENGQLTLASVPYKTDIYHNYLDFPNLKLSESLDQWLFQAKLRINEISRPGWIWLTVITQIENQWWGVNCRIEHTDNTWISPATNFMCNFNRSEYSTERLPISPLGWYTVRIEFIREYGAFQVYLNGNLIDTYTPLDAEILKHSEFYPKIGIGFGDQPAYGDIFEAQLDEVYITNPYPTPTPISWPAVTDMQLYDSFDEIGLNEDRWNIETNLPGQFDHSQENGALFIESKAPSTHGSVWILPKSLANLSINQVRAFEGKLKSLGVEGGFGLIAISVSADISGDWFTGCFIDIGSDLNQPKFGCKVVSDDHEEFHTEWIQVDLAKFYKARIEINPENAAIRYYLDGKIIATYLPEDAARLLEAKFNPHVSMWVSKGTSLRAAVDDVQISR